jgi:alpha-glucosidase (family GH31 glycosyl hydrolase)
MSNFITSLHKSGQHFIPIVDPGIMVKDGYEPYDQGLKSNAFIKDMNGDNYLGQVWPGVTVFPDFFNPQTQDYWTDQFETFLNLVDAVGVVISALIAYL